MGKVMNFPQRKKTWPWAVGSILAVALVIVATFGGRYLASHATRIPQAPAQPVAPLNVMAVVRPQVGAAAFAIDPLAHHLVALANPSEVTCPPVGACPPQPAHSAIFIYDDATGAQVASWPLTGIASHAAHANLLLIDPLAGRAYAISQGYQGYVDSFSTLTGAYLGGYSVRLPGPLSGGAFDSGAASGTNGAAPGGSKHLLLLAGTTLVLLDAASGRIVARQTLEGQAGAFTADGPVVDAATRLAYVLLRPTQPTIPATLITYSADTLTPLGAYTLPTGTRLGPLDPTSHLLYLLAPDGSVSALSLTNLSVGGNVVAPSPVPLLRDARAIGWDDTSRRLFELRATESRALDVATGQPLGALPVAGAWPGDTPLPVDSARGLIALPAVHGDIVVAQERATAQSDQSGFAPNAATAAMLAWAALATFLPNTGQTPPFVSADTFPLDLTPGVRAQDFWIHYSDIGWQGPYPGHASVSAVADLANPGAYTVTFTIDWTQLFTRTHTWVCEVTSTGAVQLTSDTGDAVP